MTDPVSEKIASLADWRGSLLARIRQVILEADPDIVEDIKWRKATNPLGVPTWSLNGIICTGESYKDKVKLTFMKGRELNDKQGLFNVSAEGIRRAIDFTESDPLNAAALTALVREAVALNDAKGQSSGGGS
jgi:hypothetical protein